jgi:C1A family cysteine protease
MIPMPNIKKDALLGGHAVTMVGYNDTTKMFMCANSWGPSWGAGGYFYLPYDYVLSPMFAGDLCVTTFVF